MLRSAFTLALLWAAFLTVGAMDYADALDQQARYEQMVCSGAWPDYKDLNPVCD